MRALAWLAVATVALVAGCKRNENSLPAGATAPSGPPAPSWAPTKTAEPPGEPSAALEPQLLAPAKTCRALEVKGRATDGAGHAVETSAPLDQGNWLDLDDGAKLTVENVGTSRELAFRGKGRVRPCVGGEERFYVARGEVHTTAGAGARPGAEVLVATPFGVIYYGDARLDIAVEPHSLSVHAELGDAWLESVSPDGSGIVEEKIPAGTRLERKRLTLDVKGLLHTCEVTAEVAEQRAQAVLRPGTADRAAPLGSRAAEHVRARRAARFACAIVQAALGSREIDGDRDAVAQALGRAEARFLGMPSGAPNAGKTESR